LKPLFAPRQGKNTILYKAPFLLSLLLLSLLLLLV
jgi:hypothetical protein